MTNEWYEVVNSDVPLSQGDIVLECPILTWSDEPLSLESTEDVSEVLNGASLAVSADVIIMTQACDLDNQNLRAVILCPSIALTNYRTIWEEDFERQGYRPSDKAWKKQFENISKGFVWHQSILEAHEDGELETENRVVDFHEVFTLPRSFLESLVKERGKPRLRLSSPYKEHLSQAFARFFMRVGLPTPISRPWEQSK